MCGIFGILSKNKNCSTDVFKHLAKMAERRGSDSSGILHIEHDIAEVIKADYRITELIDGQKIKPGLNLGHSRLITNGEGDNQPIISPNCVVFHNGIITNTVSIWNDLREEPRLSTDTEVISVLIERHLQSGGKLSTLVTLFDEKLQGTASIAVYLHKLGKLVLYTNNSSLYVAEDDDKLAYASEFNHLSKLHFKSIHSVTTSGVIVPVPPVKKLDVNEIKLQRSRLLAQPALIKNQDKLLKSFDGKLKRCSKCILPETMPFINFDNHGVCNYCKNYKVRNQPKPLSELMDLIEPYRRVVGNECIVPFSGGRDSCFGLHLIVNELKLKPVTYTYDWGMVTDLGRRNISRMCHKLNVENIIVAADIAKKRKNIKKNLVAWLKKPHLGMMALLTAGDKHFFRYVEDVKRELDVSLNLWGINPLEVTHFKTGFLGVAPDFAETKVYSNGITKQLRYHTLRTKEMFRSPGYFNSSLWDTLSGEYYRSFHKKKDYYHIFDYWEWNETIIDEKLSDLYDWEFATDTPTSWRIGDGTAAFYNYVNFLFAGFTEHDTFRSNQVREGQITRSEALQRVEAENLPRYESIKWYLETVDIDFTSTIQIVNSAAENYRKQ